MAYAAPLCHLLHIHQKACPSAASFRKACPSISTVAQVTSPCMNHSNIPKWSHFLWCLPPKTHLPRVCQDGLHATVLNSVTFLHQNIHQRMKCRLLGLASGTLHIDTAHPRVFYLLQAPHVPWLQSKAGPCSPTMTHTPMYTAGPTPMALPALFLCLGALLLRPHFYPCLQQANPSAKFK